jgi:hypothetical protein
MKNTNLSQHELTADDLSDARLFTPQPAQGSAAEQLSRPVVGYWKDALIRLSKNRIAVFALVLIVAVALAGIVGPWFFPNTSDGTPYENSQNLNFINQGPTLGKSVLVIEDSPQYMDDKVDETFDFSAPLLKGPELVPPSGFSVVGQATVNGVALSWNTMRGVSGYQIYRTVVSGQPIVWKM